MSASRQTRDGPPSKKEFQQLLEDYRHLTRRSTEALKTALKVSTRELTTGLLKIAKNPSPKEALRIGVDVFGSAAWITNSAIKHLSTIGGMKKNIHGNINDLDTRYIIGKVARNIPIDIKEYSRQQVFNAIYRELDHDYHDPEYESPLSIPQIFPTVILVSGVLNEIYSTAAFERGVRHLEQAQGVRYLVANTHGLKSSSHNVGMLEEQLFPYVESNPDEKLWVIAYSKGGVDSLHFLEKNKAWSEKNVAGLSTIASPILGSKHLDHSILQFINKMHDLSETAAYKWLEQHWDVLAKDFQESLDHKKRKPWFRENYHLLPDNIFYTALALEADWHEGHIYLFLLRLFFRSEGPNDGIVDTDHALFPDYFKAINLGTIHGHHLISARSSTYSQEALISAHIVFLKYLNLV